jgi:hypothetical protein
MAYVYKPNDIRITFDSSINASLVTSGFFDDNIPWKPVILPATGVLEVKYRGFLFGHLKKAIGLINTLPQSSSKYVTSRVMSEF